MGSAPEDDYYELLGISADADLAEIRRAWRQLVQRWHPDRAGHDTTWIFQRLSAAYEVLSDPVARAAYDRSHPRPAEATANPDAATDAPRARAPGVLLTTLSRNIEILFA